MLHRVTNRITENLERVSVNYIEIRTILHLKMSEYEFRLYGVTDIRICDGNIALLLEARSE